MAPKVFTRILNWCTYICCCIRQNDDDDDERDDVHYQQASESDLRELLKRLACKESEEKKREEAARKIQTAVRSFLRRRKRQKGRDLESTVKEVVFDSQTEAFKKIEAAVKIQAVVRGFLVRRKFQTDWTLVNKEKNNNPPLYEDEHHICQLQVSEKQTLGYEKILTASETDLRLGGNKVVKLYWNCTRDLKVERRPDVMIVVQNREFEGHKEILAYHSQYFEEMLVNQCFGKVYSVHHVKFPNMTANAFDIVLEYMYTGELNITCQEFTEVNVAFRLLRMDEAWIKCNKLLDANLPSFRHVFYLYVGAIQFGHTNIVKNSIKFMAKNFETVVMEKEFLDLEAEQIIEVLSSEEITVRSEVVVFLSALKWLRYKFSERERHIVTVLSCVRFASMSEEEILACYHPPLLPEVVKISEIQTLLLDATCYIVAKSEGQVKHFSHLAPKPRNKNLYGEILVLWDPSNFDPEKLVED